MKRFASTMIIAAMLLGLVTAGLASDVHWCYNEPECSPDVWGTLDPEYEACTLGTAQSPIDIRDTVENERLRPLKFDYRTVPLNVENNGHTIKVNYPAGSKVVIEGAEYRLLQFHFHTLSENKVNGRPYAMEAHLVHVNSDGKLAVVGVFMEESRRDNAFIQTIWNVMPTHEEVVDAPEIEINVSRFLPENRDYYTWDGSLTTPPCSEGVRWFMLTDAVRVSTDQVAAFAELFGGNNARPVQPLNGRTIYRSDLDD